MLRITKLICLRWEILILYMKISILLKFILMEIVSLAYSSYVYCKRVQVHVIMSMYTSAFIYFKKSTHFYENWYERDTIEPFWAQCRASLSIFRVATYPYTSLGSNTSRVTSSFLPDSASYIHHASCDLFIPYEAPFSHRHLWVHTHLIPLRTMFFILNSLPVCDRSLAKGPLPVCVSVFWMGEWTVLHKFVTLY
jgi:hypothetical protein